ncbi:MAG: hypothetical protein NC086_02125 [Alistipes sp.]|nr:hypothetical protein [Alistipes sp.]
MAHARKSDHGTDAACLYNIVDQIFVGNGVGYLGNAAYAIFLGQFVSFLICGAYLLKSKTFHISSGSFRLGFSLLRRIMTLESVGHNDMQRGCRTK